MSAEPVADMPGPWQPDPVKQRRIRGGRHRLLLAGGAGPGPGVRLPAGRPVRVYAYRLADRPGRSGNREYELLAEADDVLELTQPFPVTLPIGEITP